MLSVKRFKAVSWPECETVAQRLAWIKRMAYSWGHPVDRFNCWLFDTIFERAQSLVV